MLNASMQIVILKTDFLFFLLLAGISLYSLYVFKDKQLLDIWRQVFRKPLAIASGMVLFFYLAVCLLDSRHFKHLENNKKSLAHTINGSGLALGRTLIALIENNYDQDTKQIAIPGELQKYFNKNVINID